jgi:glycosyltransferase involved in cell wall biosynthesis
MTYENRNDQPLVSVIVPCYNSEKYMDEMMNSLLRQTYKNMQIIFVDDGSVDNTVNIIHRYLSDTRITLIQQKNQYAGVARNNGMRMAAGKYVCFFDSDDILDSDMVEKLVQSAETNASDVVICNIKYMDMKSGKMLPIESNVKRSILSAYEHKAVISYRDIPDEILTIGFSGPYNKIYRRQFLLDNKLEFQDSKRDNDESFVLSVMAGAERISWLYDALYTYRINNPSSLQGFKTQDIDMDDLISTVVKTKSELKRLERYEAVRYSFCKQVLNRWYVLLDQQRSVHNFCKVYATIRERLVDILELDKNNIFDFPVYRDDYQRILTEDALSYLFWKNKQLQRFNGEKYPFPFDKLKSDVTKIAIYGAGNVGQAYVRQLIRSNDYQVVGVFDRNYVNMNDRRYEVINPDKVKLYDFDVLIVAVEDEKIAKSITDKLTWDGVDKKKILWGF